MRGVARRLIIVRELNKLRNLGCGVFIRARRIFILSQCCTDLERFANEFTNCAL